MFGGAIAALLATQAAAGTDLVPVSTSLRFLRPARPGPARVRITVLTAGKRFSTVQCELEADDATLAIATVTLAPAAALRLDAHGPGLTGPAPTEIPEVTAGPEAVASVARQVDWRAVTPWADGERSTGAFESWVRFRDDSFFSADGSVHPNWYLVAADLIGPAFALAGVALPFRVATVSLDVTAVARSTSEWLLQRIRIHGDSVATLELVAPSGAVVATATQRAVILDATADELPYSVTAFGRGNEVPV
jgi:acyl-CoA thioesterase